MLPESPTLHTLSIGEGCELTANTRGAALVSLRVPFEGRLYQPLLSYQDPARYETDAFYMGAMCGRYAGRIAGAAFNLDGKPYTIDTPPGSSHALHGGTEGFNQRIWSVSDQVATTGLKFALHSPHGDQGFPGNLTATVTYWFYGERALVVDVEARADQDTVLNLVNHAYFNLNDDSAPIDNHRLRVVAEDITELNEELIPTGRLTSVSGTEFELNGREKLRSLALDQNYVLSKADGKLGLAAVLQVDEHDFALAVHTTLPGLQVYTGDQLDGTLKPRAGLCLEAQQFPDAPNQPNFPSSRLRRGDTFQARTVYAFGRLDDVLDIIVL